MVDQALSALFALGLVFLAVIVFCALFFILIILEYCRRKSKRNGDKD